ncbi:lipoprotein N-acyltransferase Lnb domain-containing protein [Lentiprolixibacter aurantiacus]|uniref:DUF4105 domain-containing protein n=1 Tax=Lentiprolixibacter aurantiacus TaxID=2993939 RepID=A0AAE3MM98_9FLAO|nr:DUF4105 domain-containing protein [Lentiprolixibacter aurantiacus]MCX2720048.1 DUF4105 domain-containing protein [Lentiprolixibacter aurantiacus]
MPFKFRCFVVLLLTFAQVLAQDTVLSESAQISVLTCGPGQELYTAFGHSAFRVQDPAKGIDVVYNYGTFDFDAPNFYTNFARGKLIYTLSRQRFENFLYVYELEKRWVREQILDLDQEQKDDLIIFLENNYLPENRDYRYDFLFDNCSTKMPDVLSEILGNQLQFGEDHLEQRYSFRELIRQNLRVNSWSSLGIDLALGAVIDKEATVYQHMFLPVYVMRQMENTKLNGQRLVKRTRTILENDIPGQSPLFTLTPLFWLLLLLAFTAAITYIDFRNKTRSRRLDFLLFFSSGAAGCLLFFLWFFTDHTATINNFNILWLFPLNLIAAFYLLSRKGPPPVIRTYAMLLCGLLILLCLVWILGIQQLSPLVLLPILTLLIRYVWLILYLKNPKIS